MGKKHILSTYLTLAMLSGLGDNEIPHKIKKKKKTKDEIKYYELLSVTPSGKYGWFQTNVGIIKKPIAFKEKITP